MKTETPRWRKASRSNQSGGDCVEVADNLPGRVLVRDSKNAHGPVLTFATYEWRVFVTEVPPSPPLAQASVAPISPGDRGSCSF